MLGGRPLKEAKGHEGGGDAGSDKRQREYSTFEGLSDSKLTLAERISVLLKTIARYSNVGGEPEGYPGVLREGRGHVRGGASRQPGEVQGGESS